MLLDTVSAKVLVEHWTHSENALQAELYTEITVDAARTLAALRARDFLGTGLIPRQADKRSWDIWFDMGGQIHFFRSYRNWCRSNAIVLSGLTTLSDAAAKEFSGKKLGTLVLDGLVRISDAVAASLSRYRGPLSLNGLLELSDNAALALGKHRNGPGADSKDRMRAAGMKHEWNDLRLRDDLIVSAVGRSSLLTRDPKWEAYE
jgi:hypothetical protein